MYLNERSWNDLENDYYVVDRVLRAFLDIYSCIKRNYPRCEIYVSDDSKIQPSGQWFAKADEEYKRVFMTFWTKRKTYHSDDECECVLGNQNLKGGLEAYLNNSFMISFCFDNKWKQDIIQCEYYSLSKDLSQTVNIRNVYSKENLKENLKDSYVIDVLISDNSINIFSYDELWEKRKTLFPHLMFTPNVWDNLQLLERSCLNQVTIKLLELEDYSYKHTGKAFNPDYLTKTTPETKATLEKYEKEHTFQDEIGKSYIVSWHMRFTGMDGRIFFVPDYNDDKILVAYIGKKLPTVKYHN